MTRHLPQAAVYRAALLAARAGGCTCNPTISIRREGDVTFAEVQHAEDCTHRSVTRVKA